MRDYKRAAGVGAGTLNYIKSKIIQSRLEWVYRAGRKRDQLLSEAGVVFATPSPAGAQAVCVSAVVVHQTVLSSLGVA